ncbi:hypothetical protein [Luteimonas huabeiensis]|uniref:hypothetical protein n=1 Tax=Luteimonas huabeiensis TaxID=1244513 RepID=UPI0012685381|nr:hypothetical protein [Luteimonas huabeiensis]
MTVATALVSFVESYVAYIDILGFSEIVTRVSNNPDSDDLSRLFKCHQTGAGIISGNPSYGLVQFSDSIVISRAYDPVKFSEFVGIVASYQKMLLSEGFLCRGGVSRGSHYSNGTFMMSAGLVSAHSIEVSQARYPRIAISTELLKLVGEGNLAKSNVLQEDDGVFFVDYLKGLKSRELKRISKKIEICVEQCRRHNSSSVREKGLWLAEYSNSRVGSSFTRQQFGSPDWSALAGMGE